MLGIALLMLGHGLQGTLLGVRANIEAFPPAVTGVVMSGYYVGLLIGSCASRRWWRASAMSGCSRALLSLGSTAILFQALFVEPVAWFLMRLLTGYCFAGAFIVAESWLNGGASNETRGRCSRSTWWCSWVRMAAGPVPAQPRRSQGLRPVHPGLGADLGGGRADAADRGGRPRP